jgi:hypothetical protein
VATAEADAAALSKRLRVVLSVLVCVAVPLSVVEGGQPHAPAEVPHTAALVAAAATEGGGGKCTPRGSPNGASAARMLRAHASITLPARAPAAAAHVSATRLPKRAAKK